MWIEVDLGCDRLGGCLDGATSAGGVAAKVADEPREVIRGAVSQLGDSELSLVL